MSDWKRERREREKAQAQRREKAEERRRRLRAKPGALPEPPSSRSLAERLAERRQLEYLSGGFMSFTEACRRMEEVGRKSAQTRQQWIHELGSAATTARRTKLARPAGPPSHLAGKVVAFRSWSLDGYRLRSANYKQHGGYWEFGPNKAECRIRERADYLERLGDGLDAWRIRQKITDHDAPDPGCECGLYLFFKPGITALTSLSARESVFGAATAWGRIEVHADGIRAEYAEPVVLAYHPGQSVEHVERVAAIAEEACVPFVSLDRLSEEALRYGKPVPPEERPPRLSDGWALLPPERLRAWSGSGFRRMSYTHSCPEEGLVEVAAQLLEQHGGCCPMCGERVAP